MAITTVDQSETILIFTLVPRFDRKKLLNELKVSGITIKVVGIERQSVRLEIAAPDGLRIAQTNALLDGPYGGLSLGRFVGQELVLFLDRTTPSLDEIIRNPVQIQVQIQRGNVRLTTRAPKCLTVLRSEVAQRQLGQGINQRGVKRN